VSTQRLADYVVSLTYDAIPRDIQEATKRYILDAIGNAFSGLATNHGQVAIQYAKEFGLTQEATLIGGNGQSSSMNAAFANTVLGRAHTFDDTHERGIIHPGVPITMASLAVGEGVQATGKAMIVAVNAGYDVALRVAEAVCPWHYEEGFNTTGTCNTFGTTAAAGKLLGLNSEQMARALGLAGSQASGLRQYQVDGDIAVSAFHGAKAAQNGVMSALLARAGFPASPTILEGQYGFCKTFSYKFDTARLTEGLGEQFKIVETGLKPYPTCRYNHGGIDATVRLFRKYQLGAANIKSIVLRTFQAAKDECDRPNHDSVLQAIFSFQFGVAAAILHDGVVSIDALAPERVQDPDIIQLSRKIKVVVDPELNALYPDKWPYLVEAITNSGEVYRYRLDAPPGSPGNPLSDGLLRQKFIGNVEPVLGKANAQKLIDTTSRIDQLQSVGELTALLGPSG
jgi:2-methylcitrate dehydratase PrpD